MLLLVVCRSLALIVDQDTPSDASCHSNFNIPSIVTTLISPITNNHRQDIIERIRLLEAAARDGKPLPPQNDENAVFGLLG